MAAGKGTKVCSAQGRLNDVTALTSAELTDNSAGTDPEDQTIAEVTSVATAANAIALLAAEFNKLQADMAALRAAVVSGD